MQLRRPSWVGVFWGRPGTGAAGRVEPRHHRERPARPRRRAGEAPDAALSTRPGDALAITAASAAARVRPLGPVERPSDAGRGVGRLRHPLTRLGKATRAGGSLASPAAPARHRTSPSGSSCGAAVLVNQRWVSPVLPGPEPPSPSPRSGRAARAAPGAAVGRAPTDTNPRAPRALHGPAEPAVVTSGTDPGAGAGGSVCREPQSPPAAQPRASPWNSVLSSPRMASTASSARSMCTKA